MTASTFTIKVAPRGKDGAGLVKYLYGPGKANEHTDQHMVASSVQLKEAYPGALNAAEARELGHLIEGTWREQTREQLALVGAAGRGVSAASLSSSGEQGALLSAGDKEHVYHVIVSQPAGAEWTDDQYATIAHDVAQGMGFTSGPDDENGARWIAMRHGQSGGGNEHMHMVFSLVREDGAPVYLPQRDFNLAQEVRREIEQRYDFVVPLEDRKRETTRSLPAYTMGEHQQSVERAKTTGQEVPERVTLQQLVRGAATTSATEQEFINNVLNAAPGIELEPARWATSEAGERSVTGYKVRLGEQGAWRTASQLAPDLTLGELRPVWAPNETPETRAAARALWSGEQEPVAHEPVTAEVAKQHLTSAVKELEAFNEHLGTLEPHQRQEWSQALSDTAGLVSSLSTAQGENGEYLSAVGTELSRAHLNQPGRPRVHVPALESGPSRAQLAARHVQLAMRASDPRSERGWIAVMNQMGRTLDAVRDAAKARGELAAARSLDARGATVVHAVADNLTAAHGPEPVDFHSLDDMGKQQFISRAIREGRANQPQAPSGIPARRDEGPTQGPGQGRGRTL